MKKIIIISDSFKGCLSSSQVEEAIAEGIHRVLPSCQTDCIPIADGGEGILDVLVSLTHGEIITTEVHDPLMRKISARYGVLGDKKTAVIEMAEASGLPLLKPEERNPMLTTSYGTGELILHALKSGFKKILIGIGGSATNDGGMGMLQALGIHFFDQQGNSLPTGCGSILDKINRIELDQFPSLIKDVTFTVACDVDNPFYGPNGASQIFARQKGANENEIVRLDKNMHHFSTLIQKTTGRDISQLSGSGAAGGMGGAFASFLNARLVPGIDLVLDLIEFDKKIQSADLVITGEGKADHQTLMGKVPAGVLRRAQKSKIPVVLLAGSVNDVNQLNKAGFTAALSITPGPLSLQEAMSAQTALNNLRDTASQVALLTTIAIKKKGL